MPVTLRLAQSCEAPRVAAVFRQSREAFLPSLPDLHSPDEDVAFFRDVVFAECAVWVAEAQGNILGFCAVKPGWIEHLYLLPAHVGRGLGARLLDAAGAGQDHLQLWVFLNNQSAMRFYARQGFRKIRETDGADSEERMPDALLEWVRPVN
ncbi:GNAT family N-acetyltransferase [Xaviernesmea oryzae]|uniref:GNAT family N-acetyltransferase n=1 Tax=Xaviernesmea oryzae TaxID=464029 RepID=A0A1Q9B2M8_9HYPH|nr:GNAT family N-acetyltransferase [Xaviernesmea oryzae]OLP62258.1 GNAT family N-acetyltransferase [Xaviernesmea oryzae]SEL93591.1 Ribosomal protein S18 acetylase RimI [Xaviernesmea oryzae]